MKTSFATNDPLTVNIWSKKIMKSALENTIFHSLTRPQPITPKFNKNEIQKWWDYYYFSNKLNLRVEAKRALGEWFSDELDFKMMKTLSNITGIHDIMMGGLR